MTTRDLRFIKSAKPEVPHQPPTNKPSPGNIRIQVYSRAVHPGIVLPAAALKNHAWTKQLKIGQAGYVDFGWGPEEFMRYPVFTSATVSRSLFWPTPSAVHVVRLHKTPYCYFTDSQIVTLDISQEEADRLIQELYQSFQLSPSAQLVNIGEGLLPRSTIYQGRQKYYFPQTCIAWTSRLLGEANIKTCSTRAPQLLRQLRKSPKLVE